MEGYMRGEESSVDDTERGLGCSGVGWQVR